MTKTSDYAQVRAPLAAIARVRGNDGGLDARVMENISRDLPALKGAARTIGDQVIALTQTGIENSAKFAAALRTNGAVPTPLENVPAAARTSTVRHPGLAPGAQF